MVALDLLARHLVLEGLAAAGGRLGGLLKRAVETSESCVDACDDGPGFCMLRGCPRSGGGCAMGTGGNILEKLETSTCRRL